MHASISLLAAIAATGAAKTIVIAAGLKGFTFFPAVMSADVGDTLEFQFFYSTHTAVQGDFSTPCQASSSGFDSGPISSAYVFQVTVHNTDPIWYFCSTPTHCQGGMAGVINPPPPSSGETIDIYIANALNTSSSSAGKLQGGVVVPASSSSSSSFPSPSSKPSSTALSLAPSTPTRASTFSSSVSSVASSASGSPTLSPVTTSGGSSLMTSANAFLLRAILWLGVVAVMA